MHVMEHALQYSLTLEMEILQKLTTTALCLDYDRMALNVICHRAIVVFISADECTALYLLTP